MARGKRDIWATETGTGVTGIGVATASRTGGVDVGVGVSQDAIVTRVTAATQTTAFVVVPVARRDPVK